MDDKNIRPDETWQSRVSDYLDEAGMSGVVKIFSEAVQPLFPLGEHITWLLSPFVNLGKILTPESGKQNSPVSQEQPPVVGKD